MLASIFLVQTQNPVKQPPNQHYYLRHFNVSAGFRWTWECPLPNTNYFADPKSTRQGLFSSSPFLPNPISKWLAGNILDYPSVSFKLLPFVSAIWLTKFCAISIIHTLHLSILLLQNELQRRRKSDNDYCLYKQ